jgi:hypothetical protein
MLNAFLQGFGLASGLTLGVVSVLLAAGAIERLLSRGRKGLVERVRGGSR